MALRIGQSQIRDEDDTLLTGRGRYTGDQAATGAAFMAVLRSPLPAGRIASLATEPARSMPGVLAVLTAADVAAAGLGAIQPRARHPAPDGGEMFVPPYLPLVSERVRYVGDPVAVVLAESRAQAEDALEAVGLDIDPLPSVTDCVAAAAPGAPAVWDALPDNVCFLFERGDADAVAAAFAEAAHVIEKRLVITRVTAASMEPRGVLAHYDDQTDRYHLLLGTQAPHRVAEGVAQILNVDQASVHVTAVHCGGSFGMKNSPYPEYALALWAARRLGRPVRWAPGRLESFQADAHARDQVADAALALDEDGTFLALKVSAVAGLGAYLGPMTAHPPTNNMGGLAGVYRTPAIHIRVRGMLTNTQHTSPYRGAGRPEATYIVERLIDLAAARLDMDRAELRRLNMIRPDQMPFKTGLVYAYDSGDFPAVLDTALAAADWRGFPARRDEARTRGRLRGIGIANPIEIAGGPPGQPMPEFAGLEIDAGGRVTLRVGTMDTGQGHATVFRQMLSAALGVLPADIEVVMGDTDRVAKGTGTFGSRTTQSAGTAIARAGDEIVATARAQAADMLEAGTADIEFAEGVFTVAGTDRTLSLGAVAAAMPDGLGAEVFVATENATFPNGCHICEVEIDPETGAVSVDRYLVVDDVGTVINPLLMKGQIHGGIAQGLSQALFERIVYDPESGQLVTASFMDYAMPRADDLPSVAVESLPVPTPTNPLGAKGAGEAGTVGSLAAVISAVSDALAPLGIDHIDMPATSERIWRAIRDAGGEGAP